MKYSYLKVGDRIIVSGEQDGRYFDRHHGEVIEVSGYRSDGMRIVRFDGFARDVHSLEGARWGLDSEGDLTIELEKPEAPKFATAWLNHGELTFTGNTFFTQEDADNFANSEVASTADTEMVVVQMVSKHSSTVTVTSEKL